ncbi:MAG TPA: cbb3-type cytochrome c oxidase subunit II [Anaeromyxobacteraceae bacterium]|nr:cbb3-type cytochrome c oxidase subunit II [Anaeromyxobacteraceae bacterium]
MAGAIYRKPIAFALMATATVLVGTLATMALPMLRAELHVKASPDMRPLGALELAGRDVYQREGCVNCHTQTVRPLPSEVARYYKGDPAKPVSAKYSLAGEFAYDHPFLWGSKRTGPDLAFEGWIKPSATWQRAHLRDPQSKVPKSNMPAYAFIEKAALDPASVAAHMRALAKVGVPYTEAAIAEQTAALAGKTEMDALVAYTLSLGRYVDRATGGVRYDPAEENPVANDVAATQRGRGLFLANCAACHADEGEGIEGVAPSLIDGRFLEQDGDLPDAAYRAMIQGGSDVKPLLGRPGFKDGGMPAFGDLADDDAWSIVAWVRQQAHHEKAEGHEMAPAPKPEGGK